MADTESSFTTTSLNDVHPITGVYNVTPHINDSQWEHAYYDGNYDYDGYYAYVYDDHNVTPNTNGNQWEHEYYDWNYDYDGYYAYVYNDHLYEIFEFETPIYGYLWPIIVLFTTFCNFIVIGGLLRKRMRNATNLILVFIAVSDSLTGLVTLPATFHIFTNQNYALSKDWCNAAMITRLYISRAFHTISVWETLLLGCHRFVQIRHPNIEKKLCTIPVTLMTIAVIYLASFGLHVFHVFDIKAENGFCQWTVKEPCGLACMYMWLTLLLSHLLPSFALTGLAVNMIRTLNTVRQGSSVLNRSRRNKQKQNNVTIVVILVVVIILVPELPYGIFYLITVSLNHAGKRILPLRTNRLIQCIYELLLVISFHLNFWVYCVMIRSFRSYIKGLLRLLRCRPVDFERLEGEMTSSSGDGLELAGMTTGTDTDQN